MEPGEDLPSDRTWVVAHRGYSGRHPENTLEAFDAALAAGADVLETDVRLSADGFAVLLHDDTLDRTTDGRGPVSAWTARELERLDAGTWFGPEHRGQHVPRLETVIARYADRTILNLELKTDGDGERASSLAREVARLVHKFRTELRVVVSAFDHGLLGVVREVQPRIPVALLYERLPPQDVVLADVARHGARWVAPAAGDLDLAAVARLAAAGVAVVPYTVDDPGAMRRLLAAGARGLFTNEVQRLAEIIVGNG